MKMFTKAFVQEPGNGKIGHEERLIRAECERRGIPVMLFTQKKILRRQLPLAADTFIAGDMDAMHGAMRQLKIEPPSPDYYPASLQSFTYRRIWRSTLGAVERRFSEGDGEPIFAKPADRAKSFTGRVFASLDDFRELGDTSRRQEVFCSEVVEWRAEYRVYVVGDEIVSIDLYSGDPNCFLDSTSLKEALAAHRRSSEAPAAYGIDFGVLASGETALVEANDGYSLGAYQIGARDYTDLLFARWRELVSSTAEK
jgi:hypothetical protein